MNAHTEETYLPEVLAAADAYREVLLRDAASQLRFHPDEAEALFRKAARLEEAIWQVSPDPEADEIAEQIAREDGATLAAAREG